MTKRHSPSHHACPSKEIERRAEYQWPEKTTGIAESRVDGQRRAALTRLGAAGAPRCQGRRVRPDQHSVKEDESGRTGIRERSAEADHRGQRGGHEHRAEDEAPATESN